MYQFLKRKKNDVKSLEKPSKVVLRKYDSEYMKYGFIIAEN